MTGEELKAPTPAIGAAVTGLPAVGASVATSTPVALVAGTVSATGDPSVLVGGLAANPLLQGTSARLIVNEVTGGVPSTLFGRIEVFGNAADVVIANPWGMTCNGCGFIGVNRASLVSGRPTWSGNNLDGFSVTGSSVGIGTGGLDGASLRSLDLVGGAVTINGAVQLAAPGSAAYVVAGPNQVSYASLTPTGLVRSDLRPINTVDIASAGGLYADQIFVLSNELGSGVRHAGTLEARDGGLTLDVSGQLRLSGSATATRSSLVATAAGTLDASGATLRADQLVLLQSGAALTATGTQVEAGDVLFSAAGAMVTDSGLRTKARRDLRFSAGGEMLLRAPVLDAGADLVLVADGDLTLAANQLTATSVSQERLWRWFTQTTTATETRYDRAWLTAGGNVALQSSKGLLTLDGSQVVANGGSLSLQGLGVGLLARKDVMDVTIQALNTTRQPSNETPVGTRLWAKGDIAVLAHGTGADQGDLLSTGSEIESDEGHVSLLAARNLTFSNDITTDRYFERFYEVRRGLFNKKITEHIKSSSDETVQPGMLTGRSVSLSAGGQLDIVASSLMADGAVGLHADADLNLLSTGEHHLAYESRTVKKSGLFGNGGLSITLGSKTSTTISTSDATLQHGASVGSLAGDIMATAGGQYMQLSSDLTAPVGDVHISAASVALHSAPETTSVLNIIRQRQSGLTLAANHDLLDSTQGALKTIDQMGKLARRTETGRYQAMATLTSGLTIYNQYAELSKLSSLSNLAAAASNGWRIGLSLGGSSSSFESLTGTSTPIGPAITTGGNLSITASGSGADQGDITVVGARLSAGGDASLRAARDITLAAAVGTSSEQTKSRSSSGAIGISFAAGSQQTGFAVNLNASRSNGWSNGWGTTYYNTEVGAAGRLSLDSGANTTLHGAKASGHSVAALVGSTGAGNLTISSPQDQDHYRARESSVSVGANIPFGSGTGSYSVSASSLKLYAEYEGVRQQSTINAGEGGFDITVNGHTHLKGGAITTEGVPAASRLTTQTLTHETLLNRDVMEGRSWSVSVAVGNSLGGSSVGYARMDTDERSHTGASVGGLIIQSRPDLQAPRTAAMTAAQREPLVNRLVLVQQELQGLYANEPYCETCAVSGDTLRMSTGARTASLALAPSPAAAPAPGSESVQNGSTEWLDWQAEVRALEAEQGRLQQRIAAIDTTQFGTVANINVSPNVLHQPLLHTFDRTKATQELRDGVAVTAAFGKTAFKAVGTYAKQQADAARTACGNNPCDAAKEWEDGGKYKVLLHGLVGVIAGGRGGALATMSAEAATPYLRDAIIAAGIVEYTLPYNLIMSAAKTAIGGGLAGAQGAAAAFNADANNRQLHPDIQRFVKNPSRTQRFMAVNPGMSYAQAEQELARTAAAVNGVDWLRVHGDSATESARSFLIKESAGFFLPDGTTYFTPSAEDFNDAKKFATVALKGDIFTLSPELLRHRPDGAAGIIAGGKGLVDGALGFLKQKWTDITQAPDDLRAVWSALEKASLDPAAAAAAVQAAMAKVGPELRRALEESQAMATILELQGDVRGAAKLASLTALTFWDPSGKLIKGAKFGAELAEAIAQGAALKKLDGLVGKTTAMPELSAIARNNGMLAEGIAAQFSKDLGVEVKVLQDASGHGVDLYAHDATLNRYIVIEVKSSTTGNFGSLPPGGPEAFLRERAALAEQGQGFWQAHNVPLATRDAAADINSNFRNNSVGTNRPTVIGYKYEIGIPKPGQAGVPTVVIKKWGP